VCPLHRRWIGRVVKVGRKPFLPPASVRSSPGAAAHLGAWTAPQDGDALDRATTVKPSLLADLAEAARPEPEAFRGFHSAAERADGAISAKYREPMAVAAALTTQRQRCIERHSTRAGEAGARREELAETVFLAAALHAGGAVVHGLDAMRVFGELGRTP
jgi:AhpD family alkylhydroperoxidase